MSNSTPSPLSDGSSSEGSQLRALVNETLQQERQHQGAPMTPRSALLSQSPLKKPASKAQTASIASNHNSSAHGAVEKRKDHRSKTGRDRRKRTTVNTTAGSPDFSVTRLSKLELDRRRSDPHAEAVELRHLLEAAVRQVQLESKRAADLERANQETAMRFRMLNDNRVSAQQEASRAASEVKLYQAQLGNAQQDLDRARQALQEVEKQRDDAEAAAARAREKARKLHQERLIVAAKEEGRKLGFEAGFEHAKKEREMLAARQPPLLIGAPRSKNKGKERERYSSDEGSPRISRRRGPSQDEIQTASSEGLSPTQLPLRGLPVEPVGQAGPSTTTPPRSFQHPPPTDEDESQRQLTPPPQDPSISSRPYHLLKTPSVQVWPLDIPPADEVDQSYNSHENSNDPVPFRPRDQWVTANTHQKIRAKRVSGPSPSTSQNQALGAPPPPQPIFPVPVIPPGQYSNSARPPQPNKAVRFPTWARRPSLAKTKAQATSWYRRLSFRKKTKPVIDPIQEESETPRSAEAIPLPAPPTEPQSAPPAQTEHAHSGHSAENVYGTAPQPSDSWYQARRASVASTRVSQFDLLATPSMGGFGQGANRARVQAMKDRESSLGAIKEDRNSRGPDRGSAATPGPSNGRVSMTSMRPPPGSTTPHTLQQQASFGTDTRRSRRPKSIVVPDTDAVLQPPGFAYPPQPLRGGYPSNPALAHKPSIDIDVVPPTAFTPHNAQSPPHTGQNHLSPYHVFKPGPPTYSFQNLAIDPGLSGPPPRPESAATRRSAHSRSASAGAYGNPLAGSMSPQLQPPRAPFAYGSAPSASSERSGHSKRPVPRNASQSSFKLHNPDPPSESSGSPATQPPSQPTRRERPPATPGPSVSAVLNPPPMQRAKSSTSMKSMGSYMRYDPGGYDDPAFWGVDGPGGPPAATPARPRPGMLVDEHEPRLSKRISVNSGLSYA